MGDPTGACVCGEPSWGEPNHLCCQRDLLDMGLARCRAGCGAVKAPTVDEARDHALTIVADNTPDEWRSLAKRAVVAVARQGREFSTDEVWAKLDEWGIDRPPEPRAIGPVMQAADDKGVAVNTGRVTKSTDPIRHGRRVSVYTPGDHPALTSGTAA